MRVFHAAIFATPVVMMSITCAGQPPASPAPAQPVASAAVAPSEILKPALDNLGKTVAALKLDKWKKGTIRDEAGANIDAMQHDLDVTLPQLLKTADAAPEALSKALPVSRNVDALYDVLIHVFEAARVVAPGDQIGQLQQAMTTLEKARVRLGEQMEQTAAGREKQLLDLHNTVQTQAAQLHAVATAPPPPPCPAPAPAKKKKKATTTGTSTSTSTAPKTSSTPATPAPKPQ